MLTRIYATDGVVVKLNDIACWDKLGSTAHAPRWAVAYKFAPEEKETKLVGISLSVGRTGVLTPVAEFEPVELGGTTVRRATLHNSDEITRKNIRVGDRIRVRKAAEIIPEVVGVVAHTGTEEFIFPESCPVCGAEVVRLPGEAAHRCVNWACPAQLAERLRHFASREAMNIAGLGSRLAGLLVGAGVVKDVLEVFTLTEADLPVGAKTAKKIVAEIAASKHRPPENVLVALGIPGVGKGTAGALVRAFGGLGRLAAATEEEIASVEGIGAGLASAVKRWLSPALVDRLNSLGVSVEAEEAPMGPTVVFTGKLSIPRQKAAELVRSCGGRVSDSVGAKTDYLVAGEGGGAKLKKAEKLGVRVLSEEEFLAEITVRTLPEQR